MDENIDNTNSQVTTLNNKKTKHENSSVPIIYFRIDNLIKQL